MQGPVVLTVTQLNTYIRSRFEEDENLDCVFVAGEISNFTDHYRSGHLYFSLKDEKCAVRAVMFAQFARRLRFHPEDGMKVIIRGHVGVYEISGQYQLYAEDLQPDGVGALSLAFEQLKAKLQREGLFDAERKKPIPKFPSTVGVITSPTGAAVHDILTILARRYPLAQVVFCPTAVQGESAAPQIVDALERMNRLDCADVIVLGRGGGSAEDLWPFNEECVARAVSKSRIPVISAVGHETDFTICDFAADLRAPTPSAAAELAVPDRSELLAEIRFLKSRLKQAVAGKIDLSKQNLSVLAHSRAMQGMSEAIGFDRIRVDRLNGMLHDICKSRLELKKSELSRFAGRLGDLSPLTVLSRGYAAVFDRSGRAVSSADKIRAGDEIHVRMDRADLKCLVKEIGAYKNLEPEAGVKSDE